MTRYASELPEFLEDPYDEPQIALANETSLDIDTFREVWE